MAPFWVTGGILAIAFAVFAFFEARRPLRPRTEPALRRIARNAATGALAFAAAYPLQLWLLAPVAGWARAEGVGLLAWVALPAWLEVTLAVLLLDYTLWHWHWLNHHVPLLWRFHLVHHVDRDLDASTGLRFHFGEMALSVAYRGAQVVVIGATPLAVSIWVAILFVSVLFHHSNTRLPIGAERRLVAWIVTPRMHGIHHSLVRAERNSNFSSLLTVWDRLHRTLCLNVPQTQVTIGVPGYRGADDVAFGAIQALPFHGRIRPDDLPPREPAPTPAARLAE